MAWKYETFTLSEVYNLISQGHPDKRFLCETVYMAYKVAVLFDETITEKFVRDYLDALLPIDSLSHLSLVSSVLYPHLEERTAQNYMYSYSHRFWLEELRNAKLTWTWNIDAQEHTLEKLMKDFKELQDLALSVTCPT